MASLVALSSRIRLSMQETWVQSLGQEDSPGEGNDNPLQYSCLGNPMEKELGRLQSMGLQKSRAPQQQPFDIEWNFMLEAFNFLFSNTVATNYMLSIRPLKCGWYN